MVFFRRKSLLNNPFPPNFLARRFLFCPFFLPYFRAASIMVTLGNSADIGPNDLLIAAHALTEGAVLVTANEAEFSRVVGLQVANWLSP